MKKKIVIYNNNDINKLCKHLSLYKSFLYRNTIFYTNSTDEELVSIIEVLNIKNKKMRITYIYDLACTYIDSYFANKNVCGFKNNKCYTQRNNGKINGCCRCCIYHNVKGCKTSNLTCKLFFCSEVKKRCKVINYNDIKILKLFGFKQKILLKHNYFSSREEIINDLYINSILIGIVRITYRQIRNIIILNKK